MNTVLVELCNLGCSDDGGCSHGEPNCNVNERRCFRCQNSGDCLVHRNKFCRNGRCRQSEMNIQITTVLVEPCFSGCTNDQDCQGNQICDANGRCRAGEVNFIFFLYIKEKDDERVPLN